MAEIPDLPDEIDSDEELRRYVEQLHDQIKLLEKESTDSDPVTPELKQEFDKLRNKEFGKKRSISEIQALLREIQNVIEERNTDGQRLNLDKVNEELEKMEENRKDFKEEHSDYF